MDVGCHGCPCSENALAPFEINAVAVARFQVLSERRRSLAKIAKPAKTRMKMLLSDRMLTLALFACLAKDF
jgi:hypothetical protein